MAPYRFHVKKGDMMAAYARNFLKDVILRIDFVSPVPAINVAMPRTVTKTILNYFPIPEPREFVDAEIPLLGGELEKKQAGRGTDWFFYGKLREKELVITTKYIYIKLSVYTSFQDLRQQFSEISEAVFNEFPDIQGRRLGLRYINHIELPGRNPFDWKKYLKKDLLSMLNLHEDRNKIIRTVTSTELNYEDNFRLRFTYGMHNPDYPAPIKKKLFVLDYDAFNEGFLMREEINRRIEVFHTEIERMFESCITDTLRTHMSQGDNK